MRNLTFFALGFVALSAACHDTSTPSGAHSTTAGASFGPTAGGTTSAAVPPAPPSPSTPPSSSSASSAPVPSSTSSAEPLPDKLDGPYVLTYHQSGGIAGLRIHVVLDTGKRTLSYAGLRGDAPTTKDVSAADIAPVTQALEAARPSTFAPLKGAVPPDGFTYSIGLEARGKSALTSWSDGTEPPAPLAALRTAILKLRDAKFPQPPVAGPTK